MSLGHNLADENIAVGSSVVSLSQDQLELIANKRKRALEIRKLKEESENKM
jgi:hypothetical protein